MFELDHDLAQDIVDRTMAILPYNVNVMDSQGLILGSGEPERINTRHEGAQLVLANGRVVEIDEPTACRLKGVQPGINLPLLHDQRLIGVLGITGDPALLRTYAELVRMTAEMLVSQRHQQAEQQWRRQRCDDLLALLLGEGATRRAWWMRPGKWDSSHNWRVRLICSSSPRGRTSKPSVPGCCRVTRTAGASARRRPRCSGVDRRP